MQKTITGEPVHSKCAALEVCLVLPESDKNMQIETQRRLLVRDDVLAILQLSDEQLQQLINTRQLQQLRIAGQDRFDSLDVSNLIDAYKTTASRRPQ